MAGDVEIAVRRFVKRMVPLKGVEPSLARIALRLAQSLDDAEADERTLPATSKELRTVLELLRAGRGEVDELGLDAPE